MKTVAATGKVDEAIADLSAAAAEFLQQVHEGLVPDARAAAEEHLYALRAMLGRGVMGAGASQWEQHAATWRAVARLAGSQMMEDEIEQAG